MALDARAKQLKAAGQPIISFGVGEPDFPTPEPIKQAATRAMADDATHYTMVSGDPALRKLVADRTAEMTGVPFTWGQVIATSGAKEALYIAMQVLCDPGDEVLLPAPYWVSDAELAALAEVLAEHDIAVIIDEIYARISYVPVDAGCAPPRNWPTAA